MIDAMLGGRFLPRWPGQVNKYSPWRLIVDRLMGWRSQNFCCGLSKIRYLTVSGHKIGENYRRLGVDEKKIIVTGNPSYDFAHELKRSFGESEQEKFKEKLGIPRNITLFSFFLSPSSFSEAQISEVLLVVREIETIIADSFFVLKFHPKTSKEAVLEFRSRLKGLCGQFLILTEYRGEEHNVKLVLASDYLVQKQSTVGFIAVLLNKDIVSYNILDTNYEDEMYKVLEASAHVESRETLRKVLIDIRNGEFVDLRDRQKEACRNFCLETDEANKNISRVIQRHFDG